MIGEDQETSQIPGFQGRETSQALDVSQETSQTHASVVLISPDKARKGVIYPLKTGIYALVGISERTFTR